MKTEAHNPDYKLISITINNNELVYGETNNGDNKGLEVYYGGSNFHYSRRYTGRKMPMKYDILASKLSKFIPKCPEGHKLTLDRLTDEA